MNRTLFPAALMLLLLPGCGPRIWTDMKINQRPLSLLSGSAVAREHSSGTTALTGSGFLKPNTAVVVMLEEHLNACPADGASHERAQARSIVIQIDSINGLKPGPVGGTKPEGAGITILERDSGCGRTLHYPKLGSLTIDSVTDSTIAGHFSIIMEDGTLAAGAFDVAGCSSFDADRRSACQP